MATDVQAQDARFAAELSLDVDAQRVGSVYVEALFGAIDNDLAKAREVLDELHAFLTDVLNAQPEFERVLTSRLVSTEDKLGILERVLQGKASPILMNFLRTVARRERLDCLRAIYAEALKRYDQQAGRVQITICTAAPVDASVIEKVKQNLQKKFAGELVVSCKVDPNQIGGLVVQVGDTIYDGSIASQLENMRRNIIKKYVPQQ